MGGHVGGRAGFTPALADHALGVASIKPALPQARVYPAQGGVSTLG